MRLNYSGVNYAVRTMYVCLYNVASGEFRPKSFFKITMLVFQYIHIKYLTSNTWLPPVRHNVFFCTSYKIADWIVQFIEKQHQFAFLFVKYSNFQHKNLLFNIWLVFYKYNYVSIYGVFKSRYLYVVFFFVVLNFFSTFFIPLNLFEIIPYNLLSN